MNKEILCIKLVTDEKFEGDLVIKSLGSETVDRKIKPFAVN